MIEAKKIDEMIKSGKLIRLDAKRTGSRRSDLILVKLSSKAMTSKELSNVMNVKIGSVYNIVRRMEKRGLLSAFSDGKDVYYMKKQTTNEY